MSMFLLINIKKNFAKLQDLTQSHLKSTLKKTFYMYIWNRIMNVFSKVLPISRVVANG